MAKDRDQQETLADLSPEESGWFSASLKHPEAKPEEVIEELREAIPIQMVHVAVAGAGLCPLDAMRCEASVRLRSYSRLIRARSFEWRLRVDNPRISRAKQNLRVR